MQCDACQRENPVGSHFCNGCGARLAPECLRCGHRSPPDAAFCNACGARLAGAPEPPRAPEPRSYTPGHLAERILRSRSALEGERKHVAVLFCDLAGSTAVTERLGPEAMHEVMDRCFQQILEQVHRFEGTVNQFLGDGVMALFGAPLALEDAPRRAVTAGLAIQRALAPLAAEVGRRFGVELRMRIGIHAGPVVVGRIGDDLRMDYTAVGDTTILAHRLQEIAPPGGVLVSEAVEHLIAGWFEVEDLGAVGVKGKAEPVHAFAVRGERQVGGRVEAHAESGLTPLVGRDRELEALRVAFEHAREGRGQVVFLVGEAGLGKSRLLYELRRALAGSPHLWLEGHCASYATNAAFHPVVDALRRAFGIEDRDDEASALRKVAAFEERMGGGLEWTLPYVRTLLSLPSGDPEVDAMDAATRRSETFRALRARVQRGAERVPVVFVIEDLHWIDRASEEFLEYVSDAIAASRLLLLLTHRPGYRHPFGDRSYHLRLTLQPLSRADMDRMAGAVLETGDLPEPLRALIASKAEGNPFFVEEVTRSLLEEGALRRKGGGVELARRLEEVSVPDSIHDVLMARVDRLGEEPKRALQMASVVGREFALRLLARLSEVGTALGPVIEELRALELIHEKTSHPELAYMFKHALTRDVAYESVLVTRRKALHRIVGAAIEELYGDRLAEHYEALAHHYREGEAWEKAFLYAVRASEKAAAAYANQPAAEHCRRALAIADRLGAGVTDELRRELEERLGGVLFSLSEFEASGDAFRRAAALSPPELAALELGRAAHSFFWGHLSGATDAALDDAEALSRAHQLREGECFATLMRSFRCAVKGELGRYQELMAGAARLEPRVPDNVILLRYLEGQEAEWRGDYRRGAACNEAGVELARKRHLPGYLIPGQWFHAKSLCCMGRYAEALAQLREALELAERIGNLAHRTRLLNTLGWLHAEIGCHELASQYNRRSVELAEEMLERGLVAGTPEIQGNASINLSCNRIAGGDLEGAAELLAPIRVELAAPGDPWMRWRYRLHLLDAEARLALAQGRPTQALERVVEELEAARRSGARKLEARALELQGRAQLAMDLDREAEATLREALAVAEAIGYPPVRWRATSLLGVLARRAGRGPEAARLAAAASGLVDALAAPLPGELRGRFRALGTRVAEDPLGACR